MAHQYPQQQYPQQQYPQQQYNTPPPPVKKSGKKTLFFGIAGAVAAVVLAFVFIILPIIRNSPVVKTFYDDDDNKDGININIIAPPPGDREVSFIVAESGFSTNDPNIKMIEINQSISYGFDSISGEFFLMENFVAGKETAVFIDLAEPLDPRAELMLTIERNGEPVATLLSVDFIDDTTLLFQPRDISEVDFWEEGTYTFIFFMDDSVAVRTTNFFKSIPMKVLAVPIKGYYSGRIHECEGDWKFGSTMITALFPVARDDVEYILGPEQDFTDPKYDLNTRAGRRKVWQQLSALQTTNADYTMIVGFMRSPTIEGYLGYTYGGVATVVCESESDMMATVVHEIAHCYKIGDEYRGGSLNDTLNSPPYGMEGRDILSGEPAVGTKENVRGGSTVGLRGTGSVIYPEQRAYWLEGRELMGTRTSYMGGGTGEDSFMFWTSSDIWNHLFRVFTGQLAGNEPGYGSSGTSDDPEPQGEYWGLCFECFGGVYDPDGYIACTGCAAMVLISGDTFSCNDCKASYSKNNVNDKDLWIYHPACGYLLNYLRFVDHNSGSTGRASGDEVTVLEIRGFIDSTGTFLPDPWFSYQASLSMLTSNITGDYTVGVFDGRGIRLSLAYFDVTDNSQISTRGGTIFGEEAYIPVQVIVRFPDNATRVIISKGNQAIYTKDLSTSAPTVSFTGLNEGQVLSNHTTFTWESSGSDLTYRIWYYRSIDEMYLVASDITGTSYNADLTDYPGTDQGWFRILATDGGRTGTSESPKVSVPFKAPDILNHIPDGKQFKVTDIIEIQGKVYDAQDGWLWNVGYKWYVDGRLFQNYGNYYFWHAPYMLALGIHTITMVVTNSAGLSSSKDFVIEIVEDESDLPDNWPRNDITLALRLGYHLPLHRLDAPITRIEFAKMMFSFYSPPDDYPDDWTMPHLNIIVNFTDMSNDYTDMDHMYATAMIAMALMKPKDGTLDYIEELDILYMECEFDPYGILTEREAMEIMFMTTELSRTQTIDLEIYDESVFIEQLIKYGMLDEQGSFNSYNADNKMSRGMTLLRIARYLRYMHELEDKDYGIDAGYFDNYYQDD